MAPHGRGLDVGLLVTLQQVVRVVMGWRRVPGVVGRPTAQVLRPPLSRQADGRAAAHLVVRVVEPAPARRHVAARTWRGLGDEV